MDTTWMHSRNAFVKAVVVVMMIVIMLYMYELLLCGGYYDFSNLCVKRERTSWIVVSTRLYEYWVPVMVIVRIVYRTSCSVRAGYDVPWVVWYKLCGYMGADV